MEDDKPHYMMRIKPIFKELYGMDISVTPPRPKQAGSQFKYLISN